MFFFSFITFSSITLIGILKHKEQFLSLFVPSGVPLIIIPFLFLIEFLSYISRLFSLGIRLFANMMSGHTLLKIISAPLFLSISISSAFFIIDFLNIIVLHILIFMECCISFLQVYVFIVLSSIYLNDLNNINDH